MTLVRKSCLLLFACVSPIALWLWSKHFRKGITSISWLLSFLRRARLIWTCCGMEGCVFCHASMIQIIHLVGNILWVTYRNSALFNAKNLFWCLSKLGSTRWTTHRLNGGSHIYWMLGPNRLFSHSKFPSSYESFHYLEFEELQLFFCSLYLK